MPFDAAVAAKSKTIAERIGLTPLSENAVLLHKQAVEKAWRQTKKRFSYRRSTCWQMVGTYDLDCELPILLRWLQGMIASGQSTLQTSGMADHSPLAPVLALADEVAARVVRTGQTPHFAVEYFNTDPILYLQAGSARHPIAIWDYDATGKAVIVALADLAAA